MAHIPTAVQSFDFDQRLQAAGYRLVNRGKVRHTYQRDNPDILLSVATDRISIFDFVLNATVPGKGAVLTMSTVFWLSQILKDINHHLLAWGAGIDEHITAELRGDTDLQSRTLVLRRADMLLLEGIARGYLTGSMYKDYLKFGFDETGGLLYGYRLPAGLKDGSPFERPIFTPTTKADVGHDEPLDYTDVRKEFGYDSEILTLEYYSRAAEYARSHGFLLADTKFEFGTCDGKRALVLGDEVLTPDSSRLWSITEHARALQENWTPTSHDKQYTRDWGKTVATTFPGSSGKPITGVGNLDPRDSDHTGFVDQLAVPEEVLRRTSGLYIEFYRALTESAPTAAA